MSEYFPKVKSWGANVKPKLDLSNYGKEIKFKKCNRCSYIGFWKTDIANLKSDVDKLDSDKFKNVPTNLCNLKSKVDKLDGDKLVSFPVDLSKLSDVVKDDVTKKDVYNANSKNIEDKIPDITNLATNTTLNAKRNEIKKQNTQYN